jgi:hypothetical protein
LKSEFEELLLCCHSSQQATRDENYACNDILTTNVFFSALSRCSRQAVRQMCTGSGDKKDTGSPFVDPQSAGNSGERNQFNAQSSNQQSGFSTEE